MNPRLLRLTLASLAVAMLLLPARAAGESAAPALKLRIMTFNLRFASPQPPNAWPVRRPVMQAALARVAPDVFGTQEGLYQQLRDIAADRPEYDWIGIGREGGSRGEQTAIFYRRDRFEPVAYDHFWLSDTPNVIASITWGTHYHRMATWVRLRDQASGREFVVWNTHFDHEIELARQKSAELIRSRLAAVEPGLPVVLVGDFNCTAGDSVSYDTLTRGAGLTDVWLAAAKRVNEGFNTFHDYEPPLHEGVRIDWILARPPVQVLRAEIVTDHDGPQYPSDHFPVVADLEF